MAAPPLQRSYSTIRHQLGEYEQRHASMLTTEHKQLLSAVRHTLGDLEALDARIVDCMRTVMDMPWPANIGEVLREAAEKDPEARKLLDLMSTAGSQRLGAGWIGALEESGPMSEPPAVRTLRLDAQAYYECAHMLLDNLDVLPQLKGVECREIRIVRNQLVTHSDGKASGVITPSFAYTREAGPIIKGTRQASQAAMHPDPGFYVNRGALLASLERALTRALA